MGGNKGKQTLADFVYPPRGCRAALEAPQGPPVAFDKIRVPKKATTLREQQLAEAERMCKVHN